jgi:4-hydroxy-2-oxoheptanedioate aldolase
MIKHLVEQLNNLSKKYGVVGIKQSFEDEGVSVDDVISVRRLTDICDIKSFVKIGGCEAKSDVFNCIKLGVNTVIAPMVETKFALSKFTNIMSPHKEHVDSYIVIESKTAYKNIDEILNYGKDKLKGIVVGRSDFSKSYDMTKDYADSDFIYEKVEIILNKSKQIGLFTTMGGSISVKSVDFIKKMYHQKLLNKIETRNVVIELNDYTVPQIDECIKNALAFEIEWLKYKHKISTLTSEDYSNRISLLANRC